MGWRAVLLALTCALVVFAVCPVKSAYAGEGTSKEVRAVLDRMEWLGHDSFKVESGGVVIYTDPFKLGGGLPVAGLILVTHEHYDHCSPEDIAKVAGKDTVIVSPGDCDGGLKGDVRRVKPGDRLSVKGIDIEVVPAYNTNKKFHPKGNGWVGYIFTVDGQRIYIAGDTDRIPEMKGYRCDIALLPVSGTYVMTAEEAAQAAEDIGPRVAVPMHYASIVGTEKDAETFKRLYKGETYIFKQRH
ncbi:MAG: MBL fold metallo-hydrolase [Nitrospirae bacterium]|nr:MBL fold metallo-hydrolase [Nitrospirota bacterium]